MRDHTPGPWNYHRPTLAQPSAWVFGQDERPICELNDNRNEYEANAHLIVAAPDLLAAARRLNDDDYTIAAGAWVALRAAIAKAEGRE